MELIIGADIATQWRSYMTKIEMFDWIIKNNAQITRSHNMRWNRPDGSVFYNNFVLSSNHTQWPAFPTLEEAIQHAFDYQKQVIK